LGSGAIHGRVDHVDRPRRSALRSRASAPSRARHGGCCGKSRREIERLQAIIRKLQRAQFGRRSERLDPDQLALALEDLDADIGHIRESRPVVAKSSAERPAHRKPLPDHLPREDVVLDVEDTVCACCGGALHSIGESVSEMLDWVPAQLRVVRITRPKYACRICETVVQHEAPERPIAGGLATPALLAQCWSPNIVTTPRSTGNRRSSPGTASIWRVPR
jgi:hypothetical protein